MSSAQKSWDSWLAPHRSEILWALDRAQGTDLYEIGCGAGANLRFLRHRRPWLEVGGCDVRGEYVAWCQEHGLSVTFLELPAVITDWDTVLSCYTLAYLNPKLMLAQLEQIRSRILILLEPQSDYWMLKMGPNMIPRFYHNWDIALQETGWNIMAKNSIDPTEDHLTEIVVATK